MAETVGGGGWGWGEREGEIKWRLLNIMVYTHDDCGKSDRYI